MAVLELEGAESRLADDAAQSLVRAHSRHVYSYCYRHLGSREEAEDAVQATFLNAWLGLQRGTQPEAPLPWLYGIAHNVCLTRHRSLVRRRRLELVQPYAVEPASPASRRDELHGIDDALRALPADQRRAFMLREWRGFSYSEIAEEMDTSKSAVESLIFRARRGLAAGLESGVRGVRAGALCILEFGSIESLLAGAKTTILGLVGTTGGKVAATVAVVTTATTVAAAPSHPRLAQFLTAPLNAARVSIEKVVAPDEEAPSSPRPPVALPGSGEAPVSIASEGSTSIVVHPVPSSAPEGVDATLPPPTSPAPPAPTVPTDPEPVEPVATQPPTDAPAASPPAEGAGVDQQAPLLTDQPNPDAAPATPPAEPSEAPATSPSAPEETGSASNTPPAQTTPGPEGSPTGSTPTGNTGATGAADVGEPKVASPGEDSTASADEPEPLPDVDSAPAD